MRIEHLEVTAGRVSPYSVIGVGQKSPAKKSRGMGDGEEDEWGDPETQRTMWLQDEKDREPNLIYVTNEVHMAWKVRTDRQRLKAQRFFGGLGKPSVGPRTPTPAVAEGGETQAQQHPGAALGQRGGLEEQGPPIGTSSVFVGDSGRPFASRGFIPRGTWGRGRGDRFGRSRGRGRGPQY